MVLMDRDKAILREVSRWRVVMSRHIKELCGFSGIRACQKRIEILVENRYLTRNYIFNGKPPVYSLTYKSKMLLQLNKRADKIRLDQFEHDVLVLDAVCYFLKTKGLNLDDFTSDKQMHRADGFITRRHKPDFVISENGKNTAVEVELAIKTLDRLESNARDNFNKYDSQIWIIERGGKKIIENLLKMQKKYPDLFLMYVDEIKV
jgi:hypothetical protein